jgi:hypothetical protein
MKVTFKRPSRNSLLLRNTIAYYDTLKMAGDKSTNLDLRANYIQIRFHSSAIKIIFVAVLKL